MEGITDSKSKNWFEKIKYDQYCQGESEYVIRSVLALCVPIMHETSGNSNLTIIGRRKCIYENKTKHRNYVAFLHSLPHTEFELVNSK